MCSTEAGHIGYGKPVGLRRPLIELDKYEQQTSDNPFLMKHIRVLAVTPDEILGVSPGYCHRLAPSDLAKRYLCWAAGIKIDDDLSRLVDFSSCSLHQLPITG